MECGGSNLAKKQGNTKRWNTEAGVGRWPKKPDELVRGDVEQQWQKESSETEIGD